MIILVALFVGCSRLLCSVWNDTAHHHHCVWVGVFLVPFVVSVVVSGKDPPGPFPNPVAKLTCADGTAPGRVWESKSPPALNLRNIVGVGGVQSWP